VALHSDDSVTPAAPRMRLVGWQVQPIVMADDGENLTMVNVQGAQILAADWQAFKDGGDAAALEQVRRQVETPTGQLD
jgi:hypothetical protein